MAYRFGHQVGVAEAPVEPDLSEAEELCVGLPKILLGASSCQNAVVEAGPKNPGYWLQAPETAAGEMELAPVAFGSDEWEKSPCVTALFALMMLVLHQVVHPSANQAVLAWGAKSVMLRGVPIAFAAPPPKPKMGPLCAALGAVSPKTPEGVAWVKRDGLRP